MSPLSVSLATYLPDVFCVGVGDVPRDQILDGAIQTRWKILPQDQREGIKTYVVGKIIQVRFLELVKIASGV